MNNPPALVSENSLRWSSFLIRFRREDDATGWRGEIVHLQSRAATPIQSWIQVLRWMQQITPNLELQAEISSEHTPPAS